MASELDDEVSNGSSKAMTITGWILGIVPCLLFLMSGVMKIAQPKDIVEGFEHMGWPLSVATPLGAVELACTLIYLIPATSVLGAILLTGYLGGAIATHVRLSEPFWIPVLIGVVIWLGLFLRDPQLRQVLPWRK